MLRRAGKILLFLVAGLIALAAVMVVYAFTRDAVLTARSDERKAERLQLSSAERGVLADDIPVANTPAGGYGNTFPPPVLTTCTEPLVEGAPDLRGLWKTFRAERGGRPVPPGERIYHYVERIEQCGDRIVDMAGGTIADARADGTVKNGVHDVSVFDYKTPIHVIATYEDGVFVLRPLFIPGTPVTIPFIEVTRRLDEEDHLVWTRPDLGGQHVILERIGGPNDPYTRTDLPNSTSGGRQ
jgi:hypothetical protein